MREQKLLWSMLAFNVLIAGACGTFLFLTGGKTPKRANDYGATTQLQAANQCAQCGWEDVQSTEYPKYMERLRVAGCPEERVRQIVVSDIGELFARKRLREAIQFDVEWWRDDPVALPAHFLQEKNERLQQERRNLLERLLGPNAVPFEEEPALPASDIHLTGAVLGSLPLARQEMVHAICNRSLEQMESVASSHARENELLSSITLAQLREQTRGELRKILTAHEMEEFLLRFSQNAQALREELRAVGPTPEEFRNIFRGLDPLQQQIQVQYGSMEALSKKQQERYLQQCDEIFRVALGPERYRAYLLIKPARTGPQLMSRATSEAK